MKNCILKYFMFSLLTLYFTVDARAQNRNFIVNLSLGAGNSGFINNEGEGEIKRIFYPTGGLQFQKQINDNWAINFYPNVGLSGSRRVLDTPVGNITEVKSTSAFVNFALHPKYFFGENTYFSLGPELSYLLWNYGSTFNNEERLSNIKETAFFNRTNLLVSSSIGISKKITESRKNAPVEIDALWFLEFRIKKGITNILKREFFGEDATSTVLSFEILTGISFASKIRK